MAGFVSGLLESRGSWVEDSENLPAPALLADEIVESLEAALEEFRAVEEALAVKEDQNRAKQYVAGVGPK